MIPTAEIFRHTAAGDGVGRMPDIKEFQCPLCTCENYEPVQLTASDGSTYAPGIFRCIKCSFRFTDPGRYPRYGDGASFVRSIE